MPHKRAKRSARESDSKKRGEDLAPTSAESLYNEPIPKSVARVLNAAKIREDWKAAKRKMEEGNNNDSKQKDSKRRKLNGIDVSDVPTMVKKKKKKETEMSKQLTIKPGESIQHFNRRVEDDMRPLIKSAVHTSNVILRGAKSEKKNHKPTKNTEREDPPPKGSAQKQQQPGSAGLSGKEHENKAKEFEKHSSSTPRRLNDVVQAPPALKHLPRGAGSSKRDSGSVTTKRSHEGVISMSQKAMLETERHKVITRYREMKAQRLMENN